MKILRLASAGIILSIGGAAYNDRIDLALLLGGIFRLGFFDRRVALGNFNGEGGPAMGILMANEGLWYGDYWGD